MKTASLHTPGLIKITFAGSLIARRNIFGCWLDATDMPVRDGRKTRGFERVAKRDLKESYPPAVDYHATPDN